MEDFFLTIIDVSVDKNPLVLAWWVFLHWGWLALAIFALWGAYMRRLNARRYNFVMNTKYVLLAIDVPKEIEQNLRAVEQIFSHLHGIDSNANWLEKYWIGEVQVSVSLEVISIDGYIQFLIRTPEKFRDLVESAIYAQYPEAEITEVEDYATKLDLEWPNDDYDMYAAEWRLAKKDCYPILTYPFFEHSLSQELADPMASLLEVLSRLNNGEQIWIQLVLSPENSDDKWRKEGAEVIKKLLGDKTGKGSNDWMYFPRQLAHGLTESITASVIPPSDLAEADARKNERSERQRLSPRERVIIESLENKVSKLAYRVCMRILYLAPKDVFAKGKGVKPIKGALKQFATKDLNSLKENKLLRTKVQYLIPKLRHKWRSRKLWRRFRLRWNDALSKGFIMTTDELASIYHFPTETVKAPLIKKIVSRKHEPPVGLPVEAPPVFTPLSGEMPQPSPDTSSVSSSDDTPTNLPIGE